MVICPNCGNENFLEAKFCIVCGREGCEGCMEQIFNFLVVGRGVFDWWICSEECFNSFIGKLVAAVPPQAINLNDYHGDPRFPLPESKVYQIFYDVVVHLVRNVDESLAFGFRIVNREKLLNSELMKRFRIQLHIRQAENLERAGRYEDASRIYELYGMYEKAGQLRQMQKQVVVKQTVVSVDLNNLLQQIRDGGIVVLYRCPRCGGNLKIDKETTIESLKVCPYCGSNIKAMDLTEFLRTALS
jgi:DNA-directed RNA polymerase subunit RPC12/RpoP